MAWVQRDAAGNIIAFFANHQQDEVSGLDEIEATAPELLAFLNPPAPQMVRPEDLMAQFTLDDAVRIRSAVNSNDQFWFLWSQLAAQKDPMDATSGRFVAGWAALKTVLGDARMAAVADALGVTIS
jgi:hypothetical protein